MDEPDFMDAYDEDASLFSQGEYLIPSKSSVEYEHRSVKSGLYRNSRVPRTIRCKIWCAMYWTRERVVWNTVVVLMTIAICLSSSFIINFLNREWHHGLKSGECSNSKCSIVVRGITSKCCCTTLFNLSNDHHGVDRNVTEIEVCNLPRENCLEAGAVNHDVLIAFATYKCWLDAGGGIWRSPPNLWILKLLCNIGIVMLGIICLFIVSACSRSVPAALLPGYMSTIHNIDEANKTYGIHSLY